MTAPGADLRPTSIYTLPERLRPALAEPWGPVVDTQTLALMLKPTDTILAVGDVVSATLQDLGVKPRLFVCDYETQRGGEDLVLRQRLSAWGDRGVIVRNEAATVSRAAWDAVRAALEQPEGITTRIVVAGEEDLVGIPCFLEAPEGAIVLYGMPGRGVVVCTVTPALQAKVAHLVQQMALEG